MASVVLRDRAGGAGGPSGASLAIDPATESGWKSSSTNGTTNIHSRLEIRRGRFQCSIPVTGPRMSVALAGLVYGAA